jgi:hypothetical protein
MNRIEEYGRRALALLDWKGQGSDEAQPSITGCWRKDPGSACLDVSHWYLTWNGQKCLCKGLIFRRLGRKQALFDPFLTRKGVDFSAVRKKVPVFFVLAGSCFSQRARKGESDCGMRFHREICETRERSRRYKVVSAGRLSADCGVEASSRKGREGGDYECD